MTERIRAAQVLSAIRKMRPAWFVHKEGDTFGGHKKPFDCWILAEGRFFAIEFKRAGGRLLEHQETGLSKVQQAGGYAWVVWFDCARASESRVITSNIAFLKETPVSKIASNIIRLVESCINYN